MEKLGFVLILTLVGIGLAFALARSAFALSRSERGSERDGRDAGSMPWSGDVGLVALAVVGALSGVALLRFAKTSGGASWALSGISLGVAVSAAAAVVRGRASASRTLETTGAAAIVSIAASTLGATILALAVVRLGPPIVVADALARVLGGYALGAAVVVLAVGRAGEPFLVAAASASATTIAASTVAFRNGASLRASGFDPLALVALPLALHAFAAIAIAIGVLAVRVDDGELPQAARLRGFAVATALTALAAIATSDWWGRPPGEGAWLALSSVTGAAAAWIALWIGRYYDDPHARPQRTLARATDVRTRTMTGAVHGMEGGVALLALAALSIVLAARTGELLALDGGAVLGVAVASATLVAASGYLDAAASADAGADAYSARVPTLAQDVLAVAFIVFLLVERLDRGRAVVTWIVAAVGLVLAIVCERASSARAQTSWVLRAVAQSAPGVVSVIALAVAAFGGT